MNLVFRKDGVPPSFPDDVTYPPFDPVDVSAAALRWLICVMDDDDQSMGFIAGCLSYAVLNGALTSKQMRGCEKVLDRVREDFAHLQLDCQADPVDVTA